MKRSYLRQVGVQANDDNPTMYIGWFHEWQRRRDNDLCGIVEKEDGTIDIVSYKHIVFIPTQKMPESTL